VHDTVFITKCAAVNKRLIAAISLGLVFSGKKYIKHFNYDCGQGGKGEELNVYRLGRLRGRSNPFRDSREENTTLGEGFSIGRGVRRT
jgi:hypothetical protein